MDYRHICLPICIARKQINFHILSHSLLFLFCFGGILWCLWFVPGVVPGTMQYRGSLCHIQGRHVAPVLSLQSHFSQFKRFFKIKRLYYFMMWKL